MDTHRPNETLDDIVQQHGTGTGTGQRWRQERSLFGDERRVRKRKAAEENHKLGRPFRVPIERLQSLLSDESNPFRDAPLDVQAAVNQIPLAPRSLQPNLSRREEPHLYVAAYGEPIRKDNVTRRRQYGARYGKEPLGGFWDRIYFTDEAHFNPTERFQKPRILRRRKERLKPGNVRVNNKVKKSKLTVHMFAYVNWDVKSKLYFYNDDDDILAIPKPPAKPRRSKYETPD